MLSDKKPAKLIPIEEPKDHLEQPSGITSKLTHGFVSTFKEENKRHDSSKEDSTKGDSNGSCSIDAELEKQKQELLERARRKKEQMPKDAKGDAVSVSNVKILKDAKVIIGKMKKPNKKPSPGRTVLDMNRDYNWYQQYYTNYYSLDPYTSAYYAQYAMVTSGDYSNASLTGWLESYGLSYDEKNTSNMPLIPPTAEQIEMEASDDSSVTEKQAQYSASGELSEQENNDVQANGGSKIEVITPSVPAAANEVYFMNCDVAASQSCDEDMDMDSDQEDCASPPAPPPPPSPPTVTSLVVEEKIYLPNGLEVPPGTKEVIVHPYTPTHPLAPQFTAEQIHSALESLETVSASN